MFKKKQIKRKITSSALHVYKLGNSEISVHFNDCEFSTAHIYPSSVSSLEQIDEIISLLQDIRTNLVEEKLISVVHKKL